MSSFRGAAIPPSGPSNSAVAASVRELREQLATLASVIENLTERVSQSEQSVRDGVIASAAMMQLLAGRINDVEYDLQLECIVRKTGSDDVPADKLPERVVEDDFVERVNEVMTSKYETNATVAPVVTVATVAPTPSRQPVVAMTALPKQSYTSKPMFGGTAPQKTKAPDANLPPPPPPPPVPLAIPKNKGWGMRRVH